MDLETLRNYCMNKPGASETFPFGPDHLVFKVAGRMFALAALREEPLRLNLKCDPFRAVALRDAHAAILPGYHMNKRHWNTLILDGSLPDALLGELIDHSYALVVQGLPKAKRPALE